MNKYEKRSKKSYNKKAENYDSTFDGKFTVKFKKIMCETVVIKENDTVVDVACGNGRLLKMFAEKTTFNGYGVDISEKMVEQAKITNPNMNFYVAGCESLPFDQGQIDVMTVCAAYHHFPNIEAFATEAKRVIKKGGFLHVAEVYLPGFLRTLFNPFVKFSKAGDVKFYSPKEIVTLFENNGFIQKDIKIHGKVQMISLQKQ